MTLNDLSPSLAETITKDYMYGLYHKSQWNLITHTKITEKFETNKDVVLAISRGRNDERFIERVGEDDYRLMSLLLKESAYHKSEYEANMPTKLAKKYNVPMNIVRNLVRKAKYER